MYHYINQSKKGSTFWTLSTNSFEQIDIRSDFSFWLLNRISCGMLLISASFFLVAFPNEAFIFFAFSPNARESQLLPREKFVVYH